MMVNDRRRDDREYCDPELIDVVATVQPVIDDRESDRERAAEPQEQDQPGEHEDRLAGTARFHRRERWIHDRQAAALLGELLAGVTLRAKLAVGERSHALALLVELASQLGVLGL